MLSASRIHNYISNLADYRSPSCATSSFVEICSFNGLAINRKIIEFDGETVLCRVCGDKASGFHYGVHACEGCKGFFRRSIQQKIQYRACLKNQECSISRVNRNRCQYCRLKKCIAVGMSRDAVRFGRVPKKEKAKILEQMQKVNLNSQTNYLAAILQNDNHVISQTVKAHAQTNEFTREKFERFQKRAWQKPEFITCSSNKACPLNPYPEGNSDKRWTEMSDSFTPAIQSVVDFAKAIPGFTVLNQEDQVTLLKAGTFEVLLLRLSCLFDCQTNTMLFVDGKLYKKSCSEDGSGGFLQDSMFEFAERLNDLKLTDDEMGLFAGIVIIGSNRPGLRNTEHVECIQAKLTHGLQSMMLQNHPDDPALFGKLLMKIADLRTLNALHSEKLLGMSLCRYSSNRKTVEPATDDGRVAGEEKSHCPFSQQSQQSLAPPPPPPNHPPYPSLLSANDTIIPNIKQDLTSLPTVANYQSQLDMVKKIKAEVTSHSIPQLERIVENATPNSSPSARNTSHNQTNFLSHWRDRTSGKLPAMDSYLHASMMNHLKQNVLAANAERDKFQTVRGLLNSTPELLYSPYYPYSYPSDVLYPYYPYTRYHSPFVNNNQEVDLTASSKAYKWKEHRDRSPQPEQRWRLDSTGSRNSVKTEESSSPGNSSSSSPNGWSEFGRGRKESRSPMKESTSAPRGETASTNQGTSASNTSPNIVSEPLNLCTMDI